VRTVDKREVILHINERTKFLLNERAVRFADLREGAEIDALFDQVEDRNVASSVTIAGAKVPPAKIIEGTVVRVLEDENLIIIRTAAREEVELVIDERTTLTIDERAARLAHFRPGTTVKVNFDVRQRKNIARSVVAMPKRPR
jgi:hypothetical protein